MQSVESVKSLKGYFIFFGGISLLNGIVRLMSNNLDLSFFTFVSFILTFAFAGLYLYIGVQFDYLIRNSLGFIKKSIISVACFGILSYIVFGLLNPELNKAVIPSILIILLINGYLFKSVEKVGNSHNYEE